MKVKKGQEASLTQPLLKDLIDRHSIDAKNALDQMTSDTGASLQQPDLYQDPGQGYNASLVFPQD